MDPHAGAGMKATAGAEFAQIDRMLERAKQAQLAGDDRAATRWHWQLVKYGRRAKRARTKAAAFAAAAYYHGFVAYREHHYAKAEKLYKHAIALGLQNDWAYMNAGCALREQGKLPEAFAYFKRAAELNPEGIQTATALGNTAYELGEAALAAQAWAHSLTRETTDPAAHYDQAILSLMLGDYATGWRLHVRRWEAPLFAAAHRPPPTPNWDGTATDARLMVFGEQGNGDAIMLLRWLPWVRALAPNTVLCIHRPLVRLCRATWPDLEVVPLEEMPAHDQKVSVFDLPTLAGCVDRQAVPPGDILRAPADDPSPLYRALRPGVKNVGLVWAGGTDTHHDWRRSVPWELYRPLLDVPGCHFVVMQRERIEALTDEDRARVAIAQEVGAGLRDFGDTAVWLENLDLLISVDTGIAHLAGALGLSCWMPTPRLPDYRWGLTGARTPWYPWHRLFRQEVAQAWEPVIARIAAALERFAAGEDVQLNADAG